MNKLENKALKEVIYYEKLENGLSVYFYIKKNSHKNFAQFTTKYGSINNEFVPNNKEKIKKYVNGIAHFLEHRMFTNENGIDTMEFFSQSGANANASTTLDKTSYEFEGTENLTENVLFLLDYVQAPHFTDEDIENEKGIIEQEIRMIDDEPWALLYDKIREATFVKHPAKETVQGTITDIKQITKEDLYDCYNTFYHPSNMILVVTGDFDPEELLEQIKNNQSNKQFEKRDKVAITKIEEPSKVNKEKLIAYANTEIPKVSYSVKISLKDVKDSDIKKTMLYLYILFLTNFDDTSELNDKLKDNDIITFSSELDVLRIDKILCISIINETKSYEEFFKLIKEEMEHLTVSETDFKRKKRALISNEVFIYDNIIGMNDAITNSIVTDGKINTNIVELIESLNLDELNKTISKIDLTCTSEIIIKNKDKEIKLDTEI